VLSIHEGDIQPSAVPEEHPAEGREVFSDAEQRALFEVARASIAYGLKQNTPLPVRAEKYPESLRVKRATFVTLRLHGKLRGCIGGFEADLPLVEDVADHAFAAAFCDPRFSPLTQEEFADLGLEISILHPFERLEFNSETELLAMLRPGVDGVLLEEGGRRNTFLPAVWRELPSPREFLCHLKRKAWLPEDYWSDSLRVYRYTVDELHEK